MEHALAEANKLHREGRYHRLAHMLSEWLTRVCDSKTAWFAEQLSTELRAIGECRRSDRKQRERVADALSYFEWRVRENKSPDLAEACKPEQCSEYKSPGLAVELACHLEGLDTYAVMNDPRLHLTQYAPRYLVSIRNLAGGV